MAVNGDDVDDDDDRHMLLISLLLCSNAALQRGPCDLPLIWVYVRVVEACGSNCLWPLVVESLWLLQGPRTKRLRRMLGKAYDTAETRSCGA